MGVGIRFDQVCYGLQVYIPCHNINTVLNGARCQCRILTRFDTDC